MSRAEAERSGTEPTVTDLTQCNDTVATSELRMHVVRTPTRQVYDHSFRPASTSSSSPASEGHGRAAREEVTSDPPPS